jgi:CubicO group peptidase (beta-lactamase class C family)
LFSKGYGLADVAHHVPNTPQTQFRLAHVTKQFTALAILLLQERGKLHVGDHICQHLASCPAAWRPITIQQCLNQTSGLPDDDPTAETATTSAALLTAYSQQPLGFTPGSQFGFSDVGYVALSVIIAKVSGEPFAMFMQKNIFDPLQMRDTGFDYPHLRLPHRAIGYTTPGVVAGDPALAFANGAYGMYTTSEDLYRWDEALNTPRLLVKASWAAMFTPYADTGFQWAGGSALMRSGEGWFITKDAGHRLAFYDDGSGHVPGLQVFNGRYLDDKVTIIELSNLQTMPENNQTIDAALAAMVFRHG